MYSNEQLLKAAMGFDTVKVLEMLKANIREETAGKHGYKKGYKIVESMMKKCDSPNLSLLKAHVYGDKFVFLDGHRIFVADTDLGYEVATDREQLKNIGIFFEKEGYKDITVNYEELSYFIKVWNPKRNCKLFLINAGDFVIAVNPYYLKDMLDYTNDCTIQVKDNRSPLYGKDDICMMLPVRYVEDLDYNEWHKNHFDIEEVAA